MTLFRFKSQGQAKAYLFSSPLWRRRETHRWYIIYCELLNDTGRRLFI